MRFGQSLTAVVVSLGLLTAGFASAQGVERPVQINVPVVLLTVTTTATVEAGATLHVILRYHIAEHSVSDAQLTLEIPPSTELLEQSDNGAVDIDDQRIVWNMGNRTPGEYTVSALFSIPSPTPNGNVLQLLGSFDSNETEMITASGQSVLRSSPKLELSREINMTSLRPGAEATVTLHIQNNGSDEAKQVSVQELLPDGLQTHGQALALFALGTLPAGESAVLSYPVKAAPGLAPGAYQSTLEILAANHPTQKINPSYEIQQPIILSAVDSSEHENETEAFIAANTPNGAVLGAATELTATGIGFKDWLLIYLAALLISLGITTLMFFPHHHNEEQ